METIDPEILRIIESADIEENLLRLTCGQLERKTYASVNRVLESIGGKWNRKAEGHVFEGAAAAALEEILLTGQYTNEKLDFGFFETPRELAEEVHRLAELHTGHSILEPSAGRGALLDALPKDTFRIHTVEIQARHADVLITKGYSCSREDFFDCRAVQKFDRIIMNPPFSVPCNPQADIDHVLHALKFLGRGGRLVSIMSASVAFRNNKKSEQFRNVIAERGCLFHNPDGAFKSSGTMVRTVTVVLDN